MRTPWPPAWRIGSQSAQRHPQCRPLALRTTRRPGSGPPERCRSRCCWTEASWPWQRFRRQELDGGSAAAAPDESLAVGPAAPAGSTGEAAAAVAWSVGLALPPGSVGAPDCSDGEAGPGTFAAGTETDGPAGPTFTCAGGPEGRDTPTFTVGAAGRGWHLDFHGRRGWGWHLDFHGRRSRDGHRGLHPHRWSSRQLHVHGWRSRRRNWDLHLHRRRGWHSDRHIQGRSRGGGKDGRAEESGHAHERGRRGSPNERAQFRIVLVKQLRSPPLPGQRRQPGSGELKWWS